jgi:hypothetical protein
MRLGETTAAILFEGQLITLVTKPIETIAEIPCVEPQIILEMKLGEITKETLREEPPITLATKLIEITMGTQQSVQLITLVM